MNLELGNVLARLAVRRRKPQRQGFIYDLAIASPDTPECRSSRFRNLSSNCLKRLASGRSGNADNRDRRRRPT
jgi:hypothetical protein